jgi:hypothetical protein
VREVRPFSFVPSFLFEVIVMSELYARCRRAVAVSVLLVGAAACGDSGGGIEPELLLPDQIAGNYRICEMVFVPEGGLPEPANIAAALDTAAAVSRLEIGSSGALRQFSLLYRMNDGGTTQVLQGSYTTGARHVDLTLGTAATARRLLLPERLRLDYDVASASFAVTQEQPAYEIAKTDYETLTRRQLPAAIRDRFSGRLTARLVVASAPCR